MKMLPEVLYIDTPWFFILTMAWNSNKFGRMMVKASTLGSESSFNDRNTCAFISLLITHQG
jgi:hypothetical protein